MINNDISLNSTAFFTIAKTMREQNKEPNELMPYSEHAGATATYAVINAMESIATGLWAVEQQQVEAAKARYLDAIAGMRRAHAYSIESDSGG